ncbi:nucleolar and spindle-associated protein 1 [Ahaetulla prasina]|uniref:nucleolar and spindle-associated protein 1 n=1 Tax=Ahaetulla prasina TaxID=499056 RepID=UPI002649CF68|nr:nucleolar and spindle-associated protein 1 [Ahaetulla prasina]
MPVMEVISSCQLEALKYSELQCLAKSVGLKANLKAAKLLNALKKHFCEENENTGIKKTSPCTDIEEKNGSQISINLSTITKRHRKWTEDNAQQTTQENLNKEKMELDSEKEVPISLNSEGNPDAGFEKILKIKQNDESQSSGTAGNLEDFVTPSQRKGRNSTRQKGVESKSLLDSLSGKKTKLGKKGIISTTPDFKKLHEAQFKKMLSIDEYIERKNKMMCNFSNAVNEIKILSKTKKSLKTSQKENLNTSSKQVHSSSRGLLLSPPSQKNRLSATGTPIKLRRSIRNSPGTANKSILSRKSSFSSTKLNCLSTTKMNVRFSESTKDNEEKRSLTKTPARKSSFLKNCTPDNQKSSECITSKDFKGGATNCQTTETSMNSAVTPFKSINQTVEPTSIKKPVFDLQASLSKPLTYQPHKGKLKPWGNPGENHQRLYSHKKYYKEPSLQTRDERREKHIQGRKQRKDQKLSTVRRLTVA